MKIKIPELREIARKAISKYGYTEEEATTILEVLLYAQLRGNNQGIVKLIGNGIPKSVEVAPIEVVKETKNSAFLNAHQTHAMVAISRASEIAMKKAKENGIAIVGVNGINTSSGALGFYAKKIAEAGLVGIIFCGSMETVAVEGSSQAMLGTNPLAAGVPNDGDPLVLDMATAAMAYFGVVEANTAGRNLPEGIAFDKEGNPTTKPADVMDGGALRTFDGGRKGSGLSMIIQALTGPLIHSYFTGVGDVAKNWGGHLIIAFDPELFGGLEVLKKGVAQMIVNIKASKKLPGTSEILIPSEHGNRLEKMALESGELEVEDNLLNQLKKVA
jgi:LDH2 family malate/lactate/ureidoglycolate dehydrogenase